MTTVFYKCFTFVWYGVNQLVAPFSCYSTPKFFNNIPQHSVIVWLKHPFQGHVLFSKSQYDLCKYFDICKLIHDPWYYCLYCVRWLEFRVWGSSHKVSAALGPKENNFILISPQNVPPFLFGPIDEFFVTSSAHAFFLTEGLCRRILVNRLASHRHFLTVTVLKGNSRLSLIILEPGFCHSGYSLIHFDGCLMFSATCRWFCSTF